jgi:hypothetical protein
MFWANNKNIKRNVFDLAIKMVLPPIVIATRKSILEVVA